MIAIIFGTAAWIGVLLLGSFWLGVDPSLGEILLISSAGIIANAVERALS